MNGLQLKQCLRETQKTECLKEKREKKHGTVNVANCQNATAVTHSVSHTDAHNSNAGCQLTPIWLL